MESGHSSHQSSVPHSTASSQSSSVSFSPKRTKQPSKISENIDVKTIQLGRVTTIEKRPLINNDVQSNDTDFVEDTSFYLYPGSFRIILCVDNCETFSG